MDDEEDINKLNEVLHENDVDTAIAKIKLEFQNLIESSDSDDEDPINCLDISDLPSDVSQVTHNLPDNTLRSEERCIINSCTDPELKNLLVLNRKKQIHLILLHNKMKDLLLECKANIAEKTEKIGKWEEQNKQSTVYIGLWRLSAPYFKDKEFFPCTLNKDTIRKRNNKELSVYTLYHNNLKWSHLDCDKLKNAVKLNYNLNQQQLLTKKNKQLHDRLMSAQDIKDEEIFQINNDIKMNNTKLSELQELEELPDPPLKSDCLLDWDRISEKFLSSKQPEVCRAFWHIYLHPKINKSNWTYRENKRIVELVQKLNMQNWDKIALLLNTGRTGYSVCQYFMSSLFEKFKTDKFTPEEDEKLLKLVEKYRKGATIQWSQVAHHFSDRYRDQLYHRYTYFLNGKNVRKEKFSNEEDILLLILIDRYGKSFTTVSKYFPERSSTQLKSRYNANLQGNLKKGCFTEAEDETIMEYVKEHGSKNWSGLTKPLGRCRGQIRQRYMLLKKFFDDNPEGKYADVKRKKHTVWEGTEREFENLREIADLFKGKDIPTIQQISELIESTAQQEKQVKAKTIAKRKRHQLLEKHGKIDEELVNYFSHSFKTRTSIKYVSGRGMAEIIQHVTDTLDMLNVKLNIPHDLETYKELDVIDRRVLVNLRNKDKQPLQPTNFTTLSLIPPNINTVVSFRSLLIKLNAFMEQGSHNLRGPHNNEFKSYFMELSEQDREKIYSFYKRFYAMYKWPSLLSLESPSEKLWKSCSFKITQKSTDRQPKRQRVEERVDATENPGCSFSTKESPEMDVDDDVEDLKKLDQFLMKQKEFV